MKHIHFCESCRIYTMEEVCPLCGSKTKLCKPAKYNLIKKS